MAGEIVAETKSVNSLDRNKNVLRSRQNAASEVGLQVKCVYGQVQNIAVVDLADHECVNERPTLRV